ncbi:MAG: hypothetical protein GEV05_13005 [Betaproteobacteria bacterium]|nr:hypothetical protein [Betaproteobacteria bacterium]
MADALPPPEPNGLCERCRNVRIVTAQTGSRFLRCKLSGLDPAFPRYPRIPVRECKGYVASENVV